MFAWYVCICIPRVVTVTVAMRSPANHLRFLRTFAIDATAWPDIYRARGENKHDIYVLKLLKVNLEGNATARGEFDSEREILASLQARIHPGAVASGFVSWVGCVLIRALVCCKCRHSWSGAPVWCDESRWNGTCLLRVTARWGIPGLPLNSPFLPLFGVTTTARAYQAWCGRGFSPPPRRSASRWTTTPEGR